MIDEERKDAEFAATKTSKAEQETVIRWDQADPMADLYTAYPAEARRWAKLGYAVQVMDRDRAGHPRSWECRVPKEAIRFRKLCAGAVVKRRTGAGRQFRSIDGASEHRTASGETSAAREGVLDA